MTTVLHETIIKGRNIAPSTRERYVRDIDLWIAYAGEDPANWTRDRAQEFYDHLLQAQGLKPQSANRVMASLRYASKWWSHRLNRADLDFAQVQKASGRKPSKKNSLDQDSATRLLNACEAGSPAGARDFALIVVGLETGMRRMSMTSMLIDQTFERPTTLKYPHTMVIAKGTDGERVPVPLSDTAILSMYPWLSWLADNNIHTGPVFRGLDEIMQRSGRNKTTAKKIAISPSTIAKMLDRRCAQAGIAHVHPHLFRYTFVTWRFAAGLLPHEVAAVTGHTMSGMGALAGYIDMQAIAEKVRNSTPSWLRDLVATR